MQLTRPNYARTLILFLAFLPVSVKAEPEMKLQPAELWTRYINTKDKGSVLPDFSLSGYHGGSIGIPEAFPTVKTFNIVDFGAVANDKNSDQQAIEKAIRAAEAAGGGVVYFPPGEFWVNTDPEKTHSIVITGSNIVLKGSGSGPGGTVIYMANYMKKSDPTFMWGNKPMFIFKNKDAPFFSSDVTKRKYEITAALSGAVKRGAQAIEVADARKFKPGDLIAIYTESNRPELVAAMLEGKAPDPRWDRLLQKGVTLQEMTRVVAVKPASTHKTGNANEGSIMVSTPITMDMSELDQWRVSVIPSLHECGFQDIHFKGNFQEEFEHHKDFIHDGGWQGVTLVGAVDSWVRRCVFTDVNGGVSLEGTMNCSVLSSAMEGNRGHTSFNILFGSYNMIGCNVANEDHGGIHGAHGVGVSHMAHNNVVWRFKSKVRGIDAHGTYPRSTLFDLYESDDLSRHGGNRVNFPNHMGGMVIWNFNQTGAPKENYDFWRNKKVTGENYEDSITVLDPVVVGFHGASTTFKPDSLSYLESNGQSVCPESLYEAQLALRYGRQPNWVDQVKAEWIKLRQN